LVSIILVNNTIFLIFEFLSPDSTFFYETLKSIYRPKKRPKNVLKNGVYAFGKLAILILFKWRVAWNLLAQPLPDNEIEKVPIKSHKIHKIISGLLEVNWKDRLPLTNVLNEIKNLNGLHITNIDHYSQEFKKNLYLVNLFTVFKRNS